MLVARSHNFLWKIWVIHGQLEVACITTIRGNNYWALTYFFPIYLGKLVLEALILSFYWGLPGNFPSIWDNLWMAKVIYSIGACWLPGNLDLLPFGRFSKEFWGSNIPFPWQFGPIPTNRVFYSPFIWVPIAFGGGTPFKGHWAIFIFGPFGGILPFQVPHNVFKRVI